MKTQREQLEVLFCSQQKLSYREIGRRKGCDRRTAKKYIEHPELIGKRREETPRPSVLDPYRSRIAAYLDEEDGDGYRATWIFDQLEKCGYTGCYELVKREVAQLKGRKQQLAYVRFETMPGEQAQVDFGEFQVELPDGTVKKYYLFAMILGFSRRLFACLLERCDLPSFLEAHIIAFELFGGVPQEILYDRMRNVFVRKLIGNEQFPGIGAPRHAQFTQSLVTLAVHYGFAPRVAPAYAAWVKGKIEKPMDYLREGFWRGYSFSSLPAANRDLTAWLAEKDQRVHGTTRERIDVRFAREKQYLHALPPSACDVSLRLVRRVSKDCRISVDGNRYIVPHTSVGHKVTIRLKDRHLRIFDDGQMIEEYDAPEGKGHVVGEDHGHYEALRADRRMQARKFGNPGRHKSKGRARLKRTISPTVPRYPVVVEPLALPEPVSLDFVVERRPMDVYARLGGEVGYA
jgi:transposase